MINYSDELNDEILAELQALNGKQEMGTDEHKISVDCLTKLIDKSIELQKLDDEKEEQEWKRKMTEQENALKEQEIKTNNALKQQQLEHEKTDQKIKNAIAIAGIVAPGLLAVWGTYKTLKFEQTGTVTTIMGKGFINKLLPKK